MAYNDEWSYRIIKDSFNYQKRSINELDFYLYIESFKEAYLKRPMEKYRMLYHMFQNKSINDNQEDDKQWKISKSNVQCIFRRVFFINMLLAIVLVTFKDVV